MNYETRLTANQGVELLSEEEAARQARRRRLMIGVVALIAVAFAGLLAYRAFFGGAGTDAAPSQAMPVVTVIQPGQQAVDHVISVTGTLAARREMPVGVAGEGGMVSRVLVEPGQWVSAGQVLATIDRSVQVQTNAQLAAQINVARADARLAQSELDRAQSLVSRGFISKADVDRRTATRDSAVARVRVAEASLGESRARTDRLDIRAPEAGMVLTRNVEPGQVVSSGSGVLFRMAKGGEMELLARLSETDLSGLPVGAQAAVTPVGTDRSFTGRVWQVSPVIDPATRQGIARLALPYDPAIRPGGFATARIVRGTQQQPLLPESAVLSDEKGNFVYLVGKGNKVERRPVTTGTVTATGIAITSGLNGTEKVVMRAGGFLNPGETVKPALAGKN
ncbi:efflux RND transporter periplasmic adaptor subunit [Sphingomonas colocasiae]|uniref:Efflux RND transporter periplasmic adaptor subunit n=1 Tax=Sphingomonas colocasiae TaxID=1848973 RepID=A0ABS7PXN4_9SPHN|nr:efflux RND transporter periplasmic adaptor subunit [Sphingomonas colocasiae]MBY8826056.1 efflux RND transporter periplasmic adaptor subunit [Sphingomonas colocasiae]